MANVNVTYEEMRAAGKQLQASYEEFNTGATKTIQGLEGMSQYLNTAADTFQQTDQQLSQQLGR